VRETVGQHAKRLDTLASSQGDLMDFRNRVEMLLVVVTQFFERNGISFTDMEGALVDMTTIRGELEGAYNYLRELVDAQAAEIRAVSRLAAARIDSLERELEAERGTSAAVQRRLEERLAAQDALIRRLSERLDAMNAETGAVDLAAVTDRVAALEDRVQQAEQGVAGHAQAIEALNNNTAEARRMFDEHVEAVEEALRGQGQRIAENAQSIGGLRSDVDHLLAHQEDVSALETRVNAAESVIRGLQEGQVQLVEKTSANRRQIAENQQAIRELLAHQQDVAELAERIGAVEAAIVLIQQAQAQDHEMALVNKQRIVQLEDLAAALRSSLWAAVTKLNETRALVDTNTAKIEALKSTDLGIQQCVSRLQTICNTVKGQYILKSWIPSIRSDRFGEMRVNMLQFPSDIVARTNNYVVSVVPHDQRASDASGFYCAFGDYRDENAINIVCKGNIGGRNDTWIVSGMQVRIWYWAKNPAASYSV
ncbi:Hypothetical protein GSB_154573, partial [Giardia duodenalis]